MSSPVPRVDIAPWGRSGSARRRITEEVDRACRSLGFLEIHGHDIPLALIEHFERVTTEFFDLPLEEKLRHRPADRKVNRGFSPLGSEALAYSLGARTPTDLFEAFNAGTDATYTDPYHQSERERLFAPTPWPDRPESMAEVWREYMAHARKLAQHLLGIFATALGLDPLFFVDRADRSPDVLRAINYELHPGDPDPLPGQMRLGAHTDYGTCTILLADEVPGLQILGPSGAWIDVVPTRGSFLVNIGDLLAAWTNDVWPSTLHRVVPPTRDPTTRNRRRSYAYFHEANHDVIVEPIEKLIGDGPRYPPFLVSDHLTGKLASSRALEPLRTTSTAGDREYT